MNTNDLSDIELHTRHWKQGTIFDESGMSMRRDKQILLQNCVFLRIRAYPQKCLRRTDFWQEKSEIEQIV